MALPAWNLQHRVVYGGVTVLHAGKVKNLDTPEDTSCSKELIISIKSRGAHHVCHRQQVAVVQLCLDLQQHTDKVNVAESTCCHCSSVLL